MRLFVLASLVLVSIVSLPAPGVALSCAAPKHTTPQDIVAHRLDIYDGQLQIPPADLLLVGTVIRVGDLLEDETGFGYRLWTVVVAGAFGDRIDGPVIEIASVKWLDDGAPGGPVMNQVSLLLGKSESGPHDAKGRIVYGHGMCSGIGTVEDPYALAADLVSIAEGAGVGYQMFPSSALEAATSPSTTTTSAPQSTTTSTTTTTVVEPVGPVDSGEVELPRRGRWVIVGLGSLVLAGLALWTWRLSRRDVLGRE